MNRKKHVIRRNLLIDVTCAGIILVVFALFHHVLPREQQSLNIVIQNPKQGASASAAGTAAAVTGGTEASVSGSSAVESADPVPERAAAVADPSAYTASGSAPGSSPGSRNRPGGSRGKGGNGGNAKGGSALTESTGGSEPASDSTPVEDKFADRYTDTVVITDTSYSSPDISVTVSEETSADGRITYYLADIYVRDVTCLQSALARGTYGSGYRDSIADMAVLNNALLAVNGDYYGNTTEGVVIRNGVIYRANPTDCDVCVLYYDGTMKVMPGSSFSLEEAIEDGAWQAWTFGPALLDTDGSALTSFSSSNRIISANPRTAIGCYEPGHYCLVVVDGRGESAGITLPELSQLFEDLGCSAAYNLDGGNSSVMVWQNAVINNPSGGGRESSDALLIAEVNSHE